MKIPIFIENTDPAVLYNELKKLEPDTEFVLDKEQSKDRGIDPVIVAAVISGSIASLSLIINSIITIWSVVYSNSKESGSIVIKDKNGTQLQFPIDTPQHKIDKFMKQAKQMNIDFIGARRD